MKADGVKNIIDKMKDLPYRAILFNGEWGIGKTYAINEALKDNDNVCIISMFGLTNIKQIYHEALFQLALKNNTGRKIGEIAKNIFDGLSQVSGTIGQINNVVQGFAKERELFLLLSKEFKQPHIIVIDDLERMSDNLKLEEVFGVIEELKQCNYVKVIIVANAEQLPDKGIFEKYKEKVIDREYHITEHAEKIEWGKLNIHTEFITEFLTFHKVKNLRTLEKAQNFFDDVKLFCSDIEDKQFIKEIRLICFAIVVESIENLYYKEREKCSIDYFPALGNELEYRILNYVQGVRSSSSLVTMLLKYYSNEAAISMDELKAEYSVYLQSGEKANFYKSDEEIKQILPDLEKGIKNAKTIGELNKFADEYVVWTEILHEENEEVLNKYKTLLHTMLEEVAREGEAEILDYGQDLFYLSSEKVKKVLSEEIEQTREVLIDIYISYLKNNTKGKKALEYSYDLKKYFQNHYYKRIVEGRLTDLYDRKFFPITLINKEEYHICYNIMYVLYHADHQRFLQYCEKLKQSCDKMSAHRIEVLMKEIVKQN